MLNEELLPELNIDEVKTANKVERFLLKAMPMFRGQAQLEQLKSVNLSGMPSKTYGNSVEETQIVRLTAKEKLLMIESTINACPMKQRRILYELYVKETPEYTLRNKLHYSRSRFWKLKQESLVWFADIFSSYQDLRIIKK